MAQASFTLDEDAMRVLDQLKATFNVKSSGDALIRALTLARVAGENADDQHQLTIVTKDGTRTRKILLTE